MDTDKFITYINWLRPIEFIGLAKLLQVEIRGKDNTLRPTACIVLDIIESWEKRPRNVRRDIFDATKSAARANKRLARRPQDVLSTNGSNA